MKWIIAFVVVSTFLILNAEGAEAKTPKLAVKRTLHEMQRRIPVKRIGDLASARKPASLTGEGPSEVWTDSEYRVRCYRFGDAVSCVKY